MDVGVHEVPEPTSTLFTSQHDCEKGRELTWNLDIIQMVCCGEGVKLSR